MSFTSASSKVEFKTSDETNSSLNELFNVHSLCRQKPFIERQLPKSFFIQPGGSGFSYDHHKGFSSPANLEETYRAGPGNATSYHSKQRSLDSQCGSQPYSEFNNISNIGTKSPPIIDSTVHLKVEAGKLPHGFEMVIDELSRVYFLNHATKETTWYDPRLPEEIQNWGMSLKDLQELHIRYLRSLSSGHSSARKQTSIALTRPVQHQFPPGNQVQLFSDSGNPTLAHQVSATNLGSNSTDKGPYPGSSGHPMTQMQYFLHTSNGNGYQEMCHLYPNCSSIQGSLSHSSNSSCSNLSTCLNGLNLSPTPAPNAMVIPHCHYGSRMGPGQSAIDHQHSHQESLDSGIGLSLVGQSYLSTCTASLHNDDCKSFDMPIKLEDSDNLEIGSNENIDDLMEIDISSLNF